MTALRPLLVLVVCVLALAAAPAAPAAPTVLTLSDGAVTPTESAAALKLAAARGELCAAKPVTPRTIAFAAARTAAEKLVRAKGGRKAVARFARSADAKTAARALAAGVAAAASGRPYGALAAFLRAHALRPKDPRALVAAAPVLTNVGRPQEALAFLAAAAQRKGAKDGPFGVSTAALIANNRGFALLALGQWKAAEKELRAAAIKAPMLSEARRNLAHAQLCAGRPVAAAAKAAVAGARRQGPPAKAVETTAESGISPERLELQAAPAAWLDLTQGASLGMPNLRVASDEAEAAALHESIRARLDGAYAAERAAQQRANDTARASAEQLAGLSPGTKQRARALWFALSHMEQHPDLAPIYARFLETERAYTRDLTAYASGQAGPTCAWRATYLSHDDAARAWFRALYDRGTAIAANASSGPLHDALVARTQASARLFLRTHVAKLSYLTEYGWRCYEDEAAAQDAGPDASDLPGALACPDSLKGRGFKFRMPFVSVKLECESVAVEYDTGTWLGAFVSVSRNFRSGETTIFGGPRVKSNPGPWGPNATIKDGLYITVGSDGTVRDLGARFETGATIGVGQTGSVTIKGEVMDFSVVGLSPIDAILGN